MYELRFKEKNDYAVEIDIRNVNKRPLKLSFIIHPTRFQMDANDDKHPQISDTPHMHIGCA